MNKKSDLGEGNNHFKPQQKSVHGMIYYPQAKKKIHFQQQMEQAHMNKIKSNNKLTKTWFYQMS